MFDCNQPIDLSQCSIPPPPKYWESDKLGVEEMNNLKMMFCSPDQSNIDLGFELVDRFGVEIPDVFCAVPQLGPIDCDYEMEYYWKDGCEGETIVRSVYDIFFELKFRISFFEKQKSKFFFNRDVIFLNTISIKPLKISETYKYTFRHHTTKTHEKPNVNFLV